MTDHPITPPLELVQQWVKKAHEEDDYATFQNVATQAARWGADQELEACVEWLFKYQYDKAVVLLRSARRPKPPSLKEQALGALNSISGGAVDAMAYIQVINTIRTALEALPDD